MAKIISDKQISEIKKIKILLEKDGVSYNHSIHGLEYQIAFETVFEIITKLEETKVAYN
jgi:hypothetical protein